MKELNQLFMMFEEHRNIDNATPMENYMRNMFPFLGIKTPLRKELVRKFYNETHILKQDFNPKLVQILWEKAEREYQYAALDYMQKSIKQINMNHLTLIEDLILSKSWWDTVDVIAPHLVGKIAMETPSEISETIEGWTHSENIWLIRSAILFQLKYKDKTNESILYSNILANAASKEFFIQKAIGWALREYSKTNPISVRHFIENHTLQKLSVREGSKYI